MRLVCLAWLWQFVCQRRCPLKRKAGRVVAVVREALVVLAEAVVDLVA